MLLLCAVLCSSGYQEAAVMEEKTVPLKRFSDGRFV